MRVRHGLMTHSLFFIELHASYMSYAQVTTENSRKRLKIAENDRDSSVTCQIVLFIIKQSSYTLIKVRVYALCFIKDVIFFFRLLLGLCSRYFAFIR